MDLTAKTLTTDPRPTTGRRPMLTLVKQRPAGKSQKARAALRLPTPLEAVAPGVHDHAAVDAPYPLSDPAIRVHISDETIWQAIRRHPEPVRAPDGTLVEPACSTWIRPMERLALILIHLDPRLNHVTHRERLRLLVELVDPTISVFQLGDSVARLRYLHTAKWLDTAAFAQCGKDDPALEDCLRVLATFAALGHWAREPQAGYRMTRALCLLGHIVRRDDPRIEAALAQN